MNSCTSGMSMKEYDTIRRRIPSGIEHELSINFDDDHPDFKNNEIAGFCFNKSSDNHPDNHLECRRKKNHNGKHWCYECGESWK